MYRIDPGAGTFEEIANTGGFVLGMCLDAEGRVYVCDGGRLAILRVTPGTGEVEVYCDSAEGAPLRTPNYPAFAADGTLWFSDSGTDHPEAEANGTLVQVAPGGGDGVTLDVRPFRFSNGIAVGPDGAIYVIESFEPCVSVVRDGVVTKLADLPRTCPDGLALDAEGGVLISCYQPNQILRVPPGGGSAELLVDDWGGAYLLTPTNVSFFGDELEHLAVASIGGWVDPRDHVALEGSPCITRRSRNVSAMIERIEVLAVGPEVSVTAGHPISSRRIRRLRSRACSTRRGSRASERLRRIRLGVSTRRWPRRSGTSRRASSAPTPGCGSRPWYGLQDLALPLLPGAQSALDIALWDVAAQMARVPLYQLLGGARTTIPAYASTPLLPTPAPTSSSCRACSRPASARSSSTPGASLIAISRCCARCTPRTPPPA